MRAQQSRKAFKGPEGRYTLVGERLNGLVSFSPHKGTRLTLAELKGTHDAATYVLFNVQEYLHICSPLSTDKEPVRTVYVSFASNNNRTEIITCHDHCFAPDGFDLLIGMSTGDVVVTSLQAQLQHSQENTKLISMLHFNAEGQTDSTRCTAVKWISATDGSVFVAAHASGNVYVYHKSFTSSSDSRFSLKVGSGRGPAMTLHVDGGAVTGLAASPDGTQVAVACKDGILRIYNVSSGILVGGFKSYHGGLLAVAWSPDGKYIATGGEDDLLSMYSVRDRRVVAWGEAHSSWISGVAFDRWRCPKRSNGDADDTQANSNDITSIFNGIYRVATVGQDCQMALWDIDAVEDLLPVLSITQSSGRPGGSSMDALSHSSNFQAAAVAADSFATASAGTPSSTRSTLSSTTGGACGTEGHWKGPQYGNSTNGSGIVPPLPRTEMQMIAPITIHRLHVEPLCGVLFSKEALYTSCHCGQVKCWKRPHSTTSSSTTTSNGST